MLEPGGWRRRVNALLTVESGERWGRLFDWGIMALIAANVVALVLETVPWLAARYGPLFGYFELFSVAVFSVEYAARVWSCTADPAYSGPVSGRLRFASRPLLIVDLLAILPFYLGTAFGLDLRSLRALRLVRLLRVLKLARYSESLRKIGDVVGRKRDDLVLAFGANGLLLLLASSIMYQLEHDAQPEAFSSIPATLWWGVVTLTTVGYGDVFPVTPLGKLFGAVVAVLGIGLFALPASILASGFVEAAHPEEDRGADDGQNYCPHCGGRIE